MWYSVLFTLLPHPNRYPLILFQTPLRAMIWYKASRMSLPCQVAARHSDSMCDNARLVTSRILFSCPGVVIVFYFTIIADEIAYLWSYKRGAYDPRIRYSCVLHSKRPRARDSVVPHILAFASRTLLCSQLLSALLCVVGIDSNIPIGNCQVGSLFHICCTYILTIHNLSPGGPPYLWALLSCNAVFEDRTLSM